VSDVVSLGRWAGDREGSDVKGDRVEVLVDTGDGVRTFEIVARRAGRRVETVTGRGVVEVTEVTRTGRTVRSARFLANRVVAVVEYPAVDTVLPDEVRTSSPSSPPDV
jgi:hypothetical protein